jgi:fructose-bisphosphate aldolase class II
VKVNDYGNAFVDDNGEFVKVSGDGVGEELWARMVDYAKDKGLKGGDYKKLNLPFENHLLSQVREARDKSVQAVDDFVYGLLADVFNASDTAPLAVAAILEAGSHDLGPKAGRLENPAEWTENRIVEKAALIDSDKGPEGDFED